MSKLSGISEITLTAFKGKNLDATCYRGYAPLSHLAMLSQADVFDQVANPDGLQRDLSPKHASDAYEYTARQPDPARPRAFPEVVINVRDKRVVDLEPLSTTNGAEGELVRVRFDLKKMPAGGKVFVSRVDGNHRLYYAAGDDRRDPLLACAPFQLHIGLTRDQERSLFVDINSNQKGLNTSHLAVMQGKLTPEEQEIRDHLDRWIARRLTDDPVSPWHGLIHLGGSKKGSRIQGLTRPVNFASLQAGVHRTLAKSQYIHDLSNPHAQYMVIRNFWTAVKRTFAQEWANPKGHLLLKNIGVMSLSILGGTIIDRCIPRGRVDTEGMSIYLGKARVRFDWDASATGDRSLAGMTGNQAALLVAGEMAAELADEPGSTGIRELEQQLLAGAARAESATEA